MDHGIDRVCKCNQQSAVFSSLLNVFLFLLFSINSSPSLLRGCHCCRRLPITTALFSHHRRSRSCRQCRFQSLRRCCYGSHCRYRFQSSSLSFDMDCLSHVAVTAALFSHHCSLDRITVTVDRHRLSLMLTKFLSL
uniref:Uncharacterized protein n=1 Tax=Manihot esculenta TaxID=3983 RepID=A0A2C9WP31_MANES